MKKLNNVRTIVGISVSLALVIGLGFLSYAIGKTGVVTLNLALIPMVLGACLYGPWVGLFLGLVDGAIVLLTDAASFLAFSPLVTILMCLLKTGLGAFFSGLVYMLLRKKNSLLEVILASITLPIVNTGIFLGGVFLFFQDLYASWNTTGGNVATFIIASTLTINFAIEFSVNLIMSSGLYVVIKAINKRYNVGSIYQNDLDPKKNN